MYAGRIVEEGITAEFFTTSLHEAFGKYAPY